MRKPPARILARAREAAKKTAWPESAFVAGVSWLWADLAGWHDEPPRNDQPQVERPSPK